MTGRERIAAAMRLRVPDRTPVMCQLAIGHYFLHTDIPREDIWFDAAGFARAALTLARRYRFDGVLVNLMPAPTHWREWIARTEDQPDGSRLLFWKTGGGCRIPPDDNLHHFLDYVPPDISSVKPERLYYDDPAGPGGIKHPFHFGLNPANRSEAEYFPEYLFRTVELLRLAADDLSVHAEVFSPFTQLMELLGYTNALMHLLTEPEKCHAILERYATGTSDLARRYAAKGVDAVLVSSAFAGAGFISREFYRTFVHPYEKRVVEAVHAARPDLPVYVHTCGAIGDRLELLLESGYNGIDTLDPPPLGDVDLEDAVRRLRGRAFIKGNIDAVNTLLRGSVEAVRADARRRVAIAGPGGGYILSSACSVAPRVAPENLKCLVEVAETCGRFA